MCSAVWGRKHEIGDGLIVSAEILVGEAPTVIGVRLLGTGSAYSDMLINLASLLLTETPFAEILVWH
jgi:hypothetical protein